MMNFISNKTWSVYEFWLVLMVSFWGWINNLSAKLPSSLRMMFTHLYTICQWYVFVVDAKEKSDMARVEQVSKWKEYGCGMARRSCGKWKPGVKCAAWGLLVYTKNERRSLISCEAQFSRGSMDNPGQTRESPCFEFTLPSGFSRDELVPLEKRQTSELLEFYRIFL